MPFRSDATLQGVPHWNGAGTHTHTVQFYGEDGFLIDELARYIGTAVVAGDATIVIATEAHRDALALRLQSSGIDIAKATDQGRYIALDAAETLEEFMVDGQPDATLLFRDRRRHSRAGDDHGQGKDSPHFSVRRNGRPVVGAGKS